MTRNPFNQQNNQWYPQLPEGYSQNNRQQINRPIPLPQQQGEIQSFQNQQGWPGNMPYLQSNPNDKYNGPQAAYNYVPSFPSFPSVPSFPSFPIGQSNPYQSGIPFPGNMNQPPQNPPPNWEPEFPTVQPFAIDPGAIVRCTHRFTYVWLSRRRGFWFYPVFVGQTSIAGYRWNNRRNRWEYIGLDLNQIQSFTCF